VHIGDTNIAGRDIIQKTVGGAFIEGNVDTGGGDFIGRDKKVYGDEVHGDKVGGSKINVGDISGQGIAIGDHAQAEHKTTYSASGDEIQGVFVNIIMAASRSAPGVQVRAIQIANALKDEIEKGPDRADDYRIAELVDDLVSLAPGTASAVLRAFESPALSALIGPTTRFALRKIQ
jgi:hypothetical protein